MMKESRVLLVPAGRMREWSGVSEAGTVPIY